MKLIRNNKNNHILKKNNIKKKIYKNLLIFKLIKQLMKTELEKQPKDKELEGNIRLLPSQMAQTYSSDIEDLNQPSRSDSIKQFSGTLDEPIMDTIVKRIKFFI